MRIGCGNGDVPSETQTTLFYVARFAEVGSGIPPRLFKANHCRTRPLSNDAVDARVPADRTSHKIPVIPCKRSAGTSAFIRVEQRQGARPK